MSVMQALLLGLLVQTSVQQDFLAGDTFNNNNHAPIDFEYSKFLATGVAPQTSVPLTPALPFGGFGFQGIGQNFPFFRPPALPVASLLLKPRLKKPGKLVCKKINKESTAQGYKITALAATISDKEDYGQQPFGLFTNLFGNHEKGGLYLRLNLLTEDPDHKGQVKVVFTSFTNGYCKADYLNPIITRKGPPGLDILAKHPLFFDYGVTPGGNDGVVVETSVVPGTANSLESSVDFLSLDDLKGRGLAVVTSTKTSALDGNVVIDGNVLACCGLVFDDKTDYDLSFLSVVQPQVPAYPAPLKQDVYPDVSKAAPSPQQPAGYPQPPRSGYPQPPTSGGYPQPPPNYPRPPPGYPQPPPGYPKPPQGYQQPQQGYPQPKQGSLQPPQGGYPNPAQASQRV